MVLTGSRWQSGPPRGLRSALSEPALLAHEVLCSPEACLAFALLYIFKNSLCLAMSHFLGFIASMNVSRFVVFTSTSVTVRGRWEVKVWFQLATLNGSHQTQMQWSAHYQDCFLEGFQQCP